MSTIEILANQEYKYGFVTDIESDMIPRGLTEETVRLISAKKNEPDWLLQFRLKAYRHWLTMDEPNYWANLKYPKVDYQDIIYYSAPKQVSYSTADYVRRQRRTFAATQFHRRLHK